MTSLEAKCNLQKNRLNLLKNAVNCFIDKDISEITIHQAQTTLEVLEANWVKFEKDNDRIYESKSELLDNLPYLTEDWYGTAQEAYITSKSTILELLQSLSGNQQSNNSQNASSNHKQQPILPKITLPQFSGDYQSWKPFSDLFTSLVIENPELSTVAKMHYLKNSLTRDAAQLISNLQVSSENFTVAWEKLKSRFENKRVLISKHLDDIFKLKPIHKKSSKNLSNLMSTVNESLGSLQSLGSPTEHWDDIMVYFIVSRLDTETHEAWEIHQGTSVDPPKLQDLQNFIDGRARALEGIEMRESIRPGSFGSSSKPQGNLLNKTKVHLSAVNLSKSKIKCVLCNENHYLSSCNAFSQKPLLQRKEFIISQRLCFNCLGPHLLRDCRSQKSCLKCGKRHHTLIHDSVNQCDNRENLPLLNHNSTDDLVDQEPINNRTVVTSNHGIPQSKDGKPIVLLATAQVKILGPGNKVITAKALIDQGSEVSFVSERIVQCLNLPRKSTSLSVLGVGGNQSASVHGQTSFTLSSIYDSKVNLSISACILPKLTSLLPSTTLFHSTWPHINNLKLADPLFMKPGSIDLILGADVYGELILPELVKGPSQTPIAQSTIFGWILSGPAGFNLASRDTSTRTFHCVSHDEVDKLLEKFWVQEETPCTVEPIVSNDNRDCEEFFKSTFKRTPSGRYEVRLPLKESPDILGDSHKPALKMLQSLQSRISVNSDYGNLYSEFIHEYEALDHMSEVTVDKLQTKPSYYLPHHGVLKSHSSTTKLRVVFNASCPTSSGLSLNDILHSGPKLQTDLSDVLIRFRSFRYVFVTDIEKMYRQISVDPQDWDLQRILWFENGKLKTYQLKTVTYGLSCAPYLALRTVEQLIIDEGKNYPLAIETLQTGRYVDDIFGGDDTIEQCLKLVKQVDQICESGCFPLKKWTANHPSILEEITSDRQNNKDCLNLDNDFVIKTLGLSWEISTDCFQFLPNVSPIKELTKRNVLSRISQFFDPLGFIAPVIIQAKIFIQQLWLIKLSWDELLPAHLVKQWQKLEDQLKYLSLIHIPRFLGTSRSSQIEIHGFSDASSLAMSAVIYVKVTNHESTSVSFVCAKTKVAPLKKTTIPRLELIAATMLVRLAKYVRKVLNLYHSQLWMWTDSSVALTWITNPPSKWKEFVSNRVNFVQETEPSAHWRYVPGNANPADCASRGMSPKLLNSHDLWWNGPPWLLKDSNNWPSSNFVPSNEANSEERRQKSVHVIQKVTEPEFLRRYSSLNKLLRITSLCLIFIEKMKKRPVSSSQLYLTPTHLNEALLRWIGVVQQIFFKKEIQSLTTQKSIDKSSHLKSLNPFIDINGLLRIGGRLSQSSLEYDIKHPYILPKESLLTRLVINDVHLKTLHGSIRETLATIRQKFWILGGRPTIKGELLHCVICARYRSERAQQLMGQLPPARLTPSRPFLHTGVDYAGPFVIKTWRGRNTKTYKGYVAVFICSSTSAIHLELVTDYTSDAFLAAYKRFISRRGICATLSSDCGTTFTGAATELKRLFSQSSEELGHLRQLLANDGTEWRFNPPAAPHFGGRWEAGVKSLKYHLKRVIGNNLLTYEEFSTILTQIEAVLNSRPLCPLTEDPDDLNVLTPAHFLVGNQLTTVPEPNIIEIPISRLSRWRLTRQMLESFWKKWSKEYLQQLQTIYKWRYPKFTFDVGTIVLIIDEQYPPSKWPMAKVIQTHPGPDGLIRVVTLKTATTILKRPITKLCPLPLDKF